MSYLFQHQMKKVGLLSSIIPTNQSANGNCVVCTRSANTNMPFRDIDAYTQLCGHVLHYNCRSGLFVVGRHLTNDSGCPGCHPVQCLTEGCNNPIPNTVSALPLCSSCVLQQTSWMVRRNNEPKNLATALSKTTQVSGFICNVAPLIPVENSDSSDRPSTAPPCAICLGHMDNVSTSNFFLHCGHKYHQNCIRTWLKKNRSCPICRATV